MSPLVLITGTGTEIGKTHAAEALLRHLGRDRRALGYKPVESGVGGAEGDDGKRLREASSFHVKHPPFAYLLKKPVSPHLAARAEGVTIEPLRIRAEVDALRAQVDVLLVELAGGLFSPVSPTTLNADLIRLFPDARVLLVAPDRLGVLHDIAATARAAAAGGIALDGLILNAPATPDASTGTNAAELSLVTRLPLLATLPRADVASIAAGDLLGAAARLALTPRP